MKNLLWETLLQIKGELFNVVLAWCHKEDTSRNITTVFLEWRTINVYTMAPMGSCCTSRRKIGLAGQVCRNNLVTLSTWRGHNSRVTRIHFAFGPCFIVIILTAFHYDVQPQHWGFMRLQWAIWLRVHWYLIMMHWRGYNPSLFVAFVQ